MGQLARQRIWTSEGTTGAERLTLLALADATPDDSYICWPSVGTIAKMAGVSTRTAQRVVQALRDAGRLAYVEGRGRTHTTRYVVLVGLTDDETREALAELNGDTAMSPFPNNKCDTAMSPFDSGKGDILEEKVTSEAGKGDTAMSPEQKEQKDQQSGEVPVAADAAPAPAPRVKKPRPTDPNQQHPAVLAYYAKTARRPNREQAHLVAERVTDIDRWEGTLAFWLGRGWSAQNVVGMVNRYERLDDRPELPRPPAQPTNGHRPLVPVPYEDEEPVYAAQQRRAAERAARQRGNPT